MKRAFLCLLSVGISAGALAVSSAAQATEVLSGDRWLEQATVVEVDASGNAYVGGGRLVVRMTPGGAITTLIDGKGDGAGGRLRGVTDVHVAATGDVYVAGADTQNVFEVTPGGAITEILDTGPNHAPQAVGTDSLGNVHVLATTTFIFDLAALHYVVDPAGTVTVQEIEDAAFSFLAMPDLVVDGGDNVYVSAWPAAVFRIAPDGTVTQVLDASGGGAGLLDDPTGLAVDAADNLYVAGRGSDNVFRVTPAGVATVIADVFGDGAGNFLQEPIGLAVDASGNVYVACIESNNAFRIEPGGAVVEILDELGDDHA